MKTFAVLAVLAQAWTLVEASNCRASSCNAGIAKAVKCNASKPGQCANAIGCQYFYSTTVYRGCATTTLTVYNSQRTVTQVALKTITTTQTQQAVDQTTINTVLTTDTISTETSSDTTVVATQTETVVTIVATETSTVTTITTTATIQETETDTTTATVSATTSIPPQVGPEYPGNQKRSTSEGTLITSPGGKSFLVPPGEDVSKYTALERRGIGSYAISYPQNVPGAVKSCLNPRSYSAACGCFGAQLKTVTKPISTETVKITKSKPVATVFKTNTITATTTKPQATNLVTATTTIVQLATATVTETASVTATSVETDSTTAEETTTFSTGTATTTTDTITQTNTQTSVATVTANPFVAGGSCGCLQPFQAGVRINTQGVFYKTTVVQSFLACAQFCDNSFACASLDYNIDTGDCRLSNRPNVASVADSSYYYGPQAVSPPGSSICSGVCSDA